MLLEGKTEYHQDPKEKYMFPFQTPEKIDEHPSPRIINSHMYFRHLPRDILKKRPKIVFLFLVTLKTLLYLSIITVIMPL